MCGLAGIFGGRPALHRSIFQMTAVQAHRGPDDHGHVFLGGGPALFAREPNDAQVPSRLLALGHRRLSILDCTEAGRQPMASADGEDWIAYNGEVYNYVELREDLSRLGHRFHTGTDTEVILAAYRQWGNDCFARFNGMWGIALWDGRRQQLVLSRDRLGVKPLHYAFVGNVLYFASEIKGILAALPEAPRANAVVVADYLKWGSVNHADQTFFAGIQAFPPGHFAVVAPDSPTRLIPQGFWTPDAKQVSANFDEAATHFRDLFSDAVRLRMRSDVKVGSCLSGGLDSSSIVCVAAGLTGAAGGMNTFTSVFDDPRFDERQWAALVNEAARAQPHYVTPSQQTFLADLDALVWHQEEPFTSASIYAQWCVMREARKAGVPVLLDGQGADEGLCGYRKFYLFYLRELARAGRWPALLGELAQLALHGDRGLLRWREGSRYLPAFLRRRVSGVDGWVDPGFASAYSQSRIDLGGYKPVAERQKDDLLRFSVPSLLRYEDRNSMAWSIESRVPFLDYRLVEWLLTLPTEVKLAGGRTKAVLREALRGTVPQKVLDRRDKMGFVTPQQEWLKTQLGETMADAFRPGRFRAARFLRAEALGDSLRAYRTGDSNISDGALFRAYMLHAWMERFDVQP